MKSEIIKAGQFAYKPRIKGKPVVVQVIVKGNKS